MSFTLRERGIRAVVLDVEGTTTPISFVYDVLFPFARREMPAYVREHIDSPELGDTFRQLHDEWIHDSVPGATTPPWRDDNREERIASIAAYAEWLMDRDRKSPGLKALQGHIWKRGYDNGALHGEVFPDVPDALARWRAAGLKIAIFSSGSVLAQQTLFRTTHSGDLTRSIDAYFDTGVGPKSAPESYGRIAASLGYPPDVLLFISDVPAELEAARAAGLAVLMCYRPGNRTTPAHQWDTVHDFTNQSVPS